MISCAPSTGRSTTGAQFIVIPNVWSSSAVRRATAKAARLALSASLENKSRVSGGGRKITRHRRLQALHASTFLIDQDEEVRSANRFANFGDEALQLLGLHDVATK